MNLRFYKIQFYIFLNFRILSRPYECSLHKSIAFIEILKRSAALLNVIAVIYYHKNNEPNEINFWNFPSNVTNLWKRYPARHRYLTATYTVDHRSTELHKNCSQCRLMGTRRVTGTAALVLCRGSFLAFTSHPIGHFMYYYYLRYGIYFSIY
jgi:hypothetical protein